MKYLQIWAWRVCRGWWVVSSAGVVGVEGLSRMERKWWRTWLFRLIERLFSLVLISWPKVFHSFFLSFILHVFYAVNSLSECGGYTI